MYIMSQDGRRIIALSEVWLSKEGDSAWAIKHDSGSDRQSITTLATYTKEIEAKLEIKGIYAALVRNERYYALD